MTVVVITVLILTGAGILLVIGKESTTAGIKEKRNTEAYGIALAGLQWELGNLANDTARTNIIDMVASNASAGITVEGTNKIYPFDKNGKFAGVPTAPPAVGTSNADWTAVGLGHYGLLAAIDPIDIKRSVIVRAIGVIADTQVVLEANLALNLVQTVPSGFVGCFDSATQVDFRDTSGPYDYIGNYRLDGGTGVPMAISADAARINGQVRAGASVAALAGYPTGRRWRGTQSLRIEGLASGVSNKTGGTNTTSWKDDNAGATPGFGTSNPYLANDPRIVDSFRDAAGTGSWFGLGLNGGRIYDGSAFTTAISNAGTTQARGLPIIGYKAAPNTTLFSTAALLGQAAWAGQKDERADSGFYGCRSDKSDLLSVTEECIKGTTGTSAPKWNEIDGPVNTSGRAWNIVSDVLRQCTGSGRSINEKTGTPWFHKTDNPNGIICANGFEWLENVAACLNVPRSVMTAMSAGGTAANSLRPNQDVSGAAGFANDFDGCHPGCLIAFDVDGDGAMTSTDHPFRSSCINLDPTVTLTYGPGAIEGDDPSLPPGAPQLWGTSTTADKPNATSTIAYARAKTPSSCTAGDPCRSGWHRWNKNPPAGITATGAKRFRVINPTTGAALAGGAGAPLGGFVREVGNPAFITRLDLSDRGPLGTCEQNCIAYGYGQDLTYGAHRSSTGVNAIPAPAGRIGTEADPNCTAKVPEHSNAGGFVQEVCNLDYDQDGFFDRKSYALTSSYREECATPHEGVAWGPAFDVSTNNDAIATGCSNRMPNHAASAPTPRLVPFCEDNNDSELQEALAQIIGSARVISKAQLLSQGKKPPEDFDGWFGGAKCHLGTDSVPAASHTHAGNLSGLPLADTDRLGRNDYFIEDSCPDPQVVILKGSPNITGNKTCGCGILIIENATFTMKEDTYFMWRGLVIWSIKDGNPHDIVLDKKGDTIFYVDGAMIATGNNKINIKLDKDGGSAIGPQKGGNGQTAKVLLRQNRGALEEAFRGLKLPVRSIRRIR